MYAKKIVFEPETRDFALYLDGELVGFARTYGEGEQTLDELVYELLNTGYADTPPPAAEVAALALEERAQQADDVAALAELDAPEPERCELCDTLTTPEQFTLYVDAAGVGHVVCAACDDEPVVSGEAEDRANRGGW